VWVLVLVLCLTAIAHQFICMYFSSVMSSPYRHMHRPRSFENNNMFNAALSTFHNETKTHQSVNNTYHTESYFLLFLFLFLFLFFPFLLLLFFSPPLLSALITEVRSLTTLALSSALTKAPLMTLSVSRSACFSD
jgi:hypothetical protein